MDLHEVLQCQLAPSQLRIYQDTILNCHLKCTNMWLWRLVFIFTFSIFQCSLSIIDLDYPSLETVKTSRTFVDSSSPGRRPQELPPGRPLPRGGGLDGEHHQDGRGRVRALRPGAERSTVNNFLHYLQGISRSATLVLAYLILKKNMRLQEAITSVKRHRSIAPNEGFMLQLIELNDDVHKLLKQSSIQK